MYRLHIDFEMGENEQEALAKANEILEKIKENKDSIGIGGSVMGVRLCLDGQRAGFNHLKMVDGRPANSKSKIEL